jgi:hypothetical protein
MKYLKGISSDKELDKTIAKLKELSTRSRGQLASSRWQISEGTAIRVLKTARYDHIFM